MKIIIEIPDKDKTEFLEGVLKQIPIPKDEETGDDLYTPLEWLQYWSKNRLVKLYLDGRKKILIKEAEKSFTYNIQKEIEK